MIDEEEKFVPEKFVFDGSDQEGKSWLVRDKQFSHLSD